MSDTLEAAFACAEHGQTHETPTQHDAQSAVVAERTRIARAIRGKANLICSCHDDDCPRLEVILALVDPAMTVDYGLAVERSRIVEAVWELEDRRHEPPWLQDDLIVRSDVLSVIWNAEVESRE